jgi:hypothetical protein
MGVNGQRPPWVPPDGPALVDPRQDLEQQDLPAAETGMKAWGYAPRLGPFAAGDSGLGAEVTWAAKGQTLEARPRPAPLPGKWVFWADRIRGYVPLGNLTVSDFTCTSKLSGFGAGTLTVTLPCGIPEDRLLALWSMRVWCYYDGAPYWCGVPTGITDDGGPAVALTLTELPGYLQKRVWDYFPSYRFNQVEQTEIFRNIASPVGDVGVALSMDPGPGYLRDRTYEYLEGQNRAELLTNLTEVLGGPEFRAQYTVDDSGARAGLPRCTLRVGYPRVGTGAAGLGLTVPGEALGYSAAWDADNMRTKTFAVGELPENAAENATRPVATKELSQADIPRLDGVDDWPGVVLTSTLNERAGAEATRQAAPSLELTVTAPEAAPAIGLYSVGDDVTVRVRTLLLPGGLEVPGRLTALEVHAAEARVTWTVVISLPAPRARATLTERLDSIDRITRGAFRRNLAPLNGG